MKLSDNPDLIQNIEGTPTIHLIEPEENLDIDIDFVGSIIASGYLSRITVEEGVKISGNITTDKDITLHERARVTGNLSTKKDIRIAKDSEVTGNLKANGTIYVDGKVKSESTIKAGSINTTRTSEVIGDIDVASNAYIGGKVDGNITAKTANITASAKFNDDKKLNCDKLTVETEKDVEESPQYGIQGGSTKIKAEYVGTGAGLEVPLSNIRELS